MQFSLKYRPTKFSEVIGQPVATRILVNSILMDRVPKALALFGLHGCGKTSLARLYAKALNCEAFNGEPCCVCPSCTAIQSGTSQTVLEYDAASRSGVDDARAFDELTAFEVPGAYRVIILDECHMLTKQAQAALLKLIEEPPPKTLFILVTTDVPRLESTILSRCLAVDLRPVGAQDLEINIKQILDAEGIEYTPTCITQIAQQGRGSVRDVQQTLEQLVLASGGNLSESNLGGILGSIPLEVYKDLAYALNAKKTHEFFKLIRKWYTQGTDLVDLFVHGVPGLAHDFMMCLAEVEDCDYYSGIEKTTMKRNLSLTYAEVKDILRVWDVDYEFMRDTKFPKIVWDKFAMGICNN